MPLIVLLAAGAVMGFVMGGKALSTGSVALSKTKNLEGSTARAIGFACLLFGLACVIGLGLIVYAIARPR